MDMSPATIKLNAILIRLAKGMISAWEVWLNSHVKAIENPDPSNFFKGQK